MKETVSGGDKLARLIQYITGEANECISYCAYHKDTEYGFHEAWELESRFGQGHDVAAAWVQRVTTGPKIEDGKPLRDFADKLAGCQATLAAMECSQTLQIDQLIQIADRLPRRVRAKWVVRNRAIKDTGRLPNLDDMVKFVKKAGEIATDTHFKMPAIGNHSNQVRTTKTKSPIKKRAAFNTKTTTNLPKAQLLAQPKQHSHQPQNPLETDLAATIVQRPTTSVWGFPSDAGGRPADTYQGQRTLCGLFP